MATPNVAIRLGTTGRAEVEGDLAAIGLAGEGSAKRIAAGFNRASDDVATATARLAQAQERQAAARAKIEAVNLGGGDAPGSNSARPIELTAAAMQKLELRAQALVAAIDPAYAAQVRFDREMGEAKTLIAANAITLDQYAAKLRAETALLNETGGAHGRAAAGAGAHKYAMQNLSYQAQDTFTQLSMGANVFQVIAIQGGQAAGAFANVGGAAGKVASFMIGPWGLAITAGLLVLGPLTDGLFKFNNELNDAVDKLKKDAAQSDISARAHEVFARSAAGVSDAIHKQNEELGRNLTSQTSANDALLVAAERQRKLEINIRNTTIALLEQAKAEAAQANATTFGAAGGAGAGMAQAIYGKRVQDYETALAQAKKDLADAESGVRLAKITQAEMAARAAVDPMAAINQQYDRMADKAKLAAKGNDQLAASIGKTLIAIERQRAAALKAEQERNQDAKRTSDPDTLTSTQVAKFLRSQLPGVHVTSTTGGKHVDGSDHYKNGAIDFVPAGGMGSMSKAQVRELFVRAGIEIRVNGKGVEQLFGPGDKGHSDHFHVAWVKGKNELAEYNDEQQRAKALERERAQGLAELRKMFDPAAEAAENYRLTLAKIAALKLDPAMAARYVEGAREAFVKANAAAFTLPDVEAYRPEFDADTTRMKDQASGKEEAKKRAAAMIVDQQERLALGQRELELVAANDNYRSIELAKLDMILRLKRDGIDAEGTVGQEILANTVRIEEQQQALNERARAMGELQRFGDQFVDTVFNPDNWKNFGDLGRTVLKMIADEFLKLAVLNPIKKLLFGGSDDGGGGGIFGKLLGSILGSVGKVGKHATGTEYFAGGPTWVGENGPEIVFAPTGSKIASADASRRAALQGGQGLNLTYAPVIDARGADSEAIARIERQMAKDKREFNTMVISAVNEGRERRYIR